uniref:Putative lipocal-1 13 lipocalin n=1 Tax=Amblyomma tuberculatum TaxID=48802 RepID=A0A6M2E7W7_9ACAR
MSTAMRTTALLFVLKYSLLSSGEDGSDGSGTAWKFIGGPGEDMFIRYRNFYSDFSKRDNVRCTMASRTLMDNNTQTATYFTKWYNTTSNKSFSVLSEYNTSGNILTATLYFPIDNVTTFNMTNNYFFNYTDGLCAVVLMPHKDQDAQPSERACEMWIRQGSTESWNSKCDTVYSAVCGEMNITIYDKEYCEKIASEEDASQTISS